MYVTDNYDLSLLYLHVEFLLACMCMVLLPRTCVSCMAYSTHAQCCSTTSCLL